MVDNEENKGPGDSGPEPKPSLGDRLNEGKEKFKEGTNKIKEGMSLNEIEGYAKKYANEVLMAIAIVVAVISSIFDFVIGSGWGIFLAGVGALYGLFGGRQAAFIVEKMLEYATKKDKSVQMIIGVIRIVVAIFFPAILFGVFGLVTGANYSKSVRES